MTPLMQNLHRKIFYYHESQLVYFNIEKQNNNKLLGLSS
jgi:hypothetical protein